MTVIIEIFDAEQKTGIYLSDCLLSKGDFEMNDTSFIPFRRGLKQVETRGFSLGSKVWLKEDKIMLWSGLKVTAIGLAKSYDEMNIHQFHQHLDDCSARGEDVGHVFYGQRIGRKIAQYNFNYFERPWGPLVVRFAGSGSDAVTEVLDGVTPSKGAEPVGAVAVLFSYFVNQEFDNPYFPFEAYGGAFEITIADKAGFNKVPYAIIDLEADTHLADDGVYELKTLKTARVILSIPHEHGSIFAVAGASFDGEVAVFQAPQVGSKLLAPDVVEKIVVKFFSSPNIFGSFVVMRHDKTDVYPAPGDSVHCSVLEDGRWAIEVKQEKVLETILGTNWKAKAASAKH